MKREAFGSSFGTMRSRQGIYGHVATSPRRDVGSTLQKSTTSPRRDVTTSRRQLENLHPIIKCQTARNLGHREAYDQARISRARRIQTSRDYPGFVSFSVLLDFIEDIMMMLLISDILFFSSMMF